MTLGLKTLGKAIALFVGVLGLTVAAANAGTGPFAFLAGNWSGEGKVVLFDGQMERIRCRASAEVGGDGISMRQNLRCASSSYSFDLRNAVVLREGRITGTWSETTYKVIGLVTGSVSGDAVSVRAEGGAFAADLTLVPTGKSLRVTLIPHGTRVREVNILLRRA